MCSAHGSASKVTDHIEMPTWFLTSILTCCTCVCVWCDAAQDYMCPEMLQQQNGMRGTMPMGGMGYTPAAAGAGSPATPHVPYDAKAVDAWAMGVLMYLLITGKYPFEVSRGASPLR